jgi:hypothetical protein
MSGLGRNPKLLSSNANPLSERSDINAKGPASVGALPDRGSIHPAKDKEMNKTELSSTAAGKPAPAGMTMQNGKQTGQVALPAPEKLKSIADLFEAPIDDARRMASILATLTEDALDKDMSEYGRPSCYHITSQQREDIMFSIYKVQDFVQQISNAMDEAIR